MLFRRLIALSFIFWAASDLTAGRYEDADLLGAAIDALYKGLQYMEDHIFEINLDGALGCKLVTDILHSFLESRPEVFVELGDHLRTQLAMLSDKAGQIADESKPYLKINEPEYYANVEGFIERSEVLMWFPGRLTQRSLQVQPLPCSNSTFNETISDNCMREILPTAGKKNKKCTISKECLDLMMKRQQRGYMLSHQVLYFQELEMYNCAERSDVKEIPKLLQDILCSNVMRDAEEIYNSGYPLNHRDLFMEQIGLCGLWGYKDFYKPSWLREILRWQKMSGCYADLATWQCTENLTKSNIRKKRTEKILEDGCLSHKTAVALLALAADIRFIVEKTFEMK